MQGGEGWTAFASGPGPRTWLTGPSAPHGLQRRSSAGRRPSYGDPAAVEGGSSRRLERGPPRCAGANAAARRGAEAHRTLHCRGPGGCRCAGLCPFPAGLAGLLPACLWRAPASQGTTCRAVARVSRSSTSVGCPTGTPSRRNCLRARHARSKGWTACARAQRTPPGSQAPPRAQVAAHRSIQRRASRPLQESRCVSWVGNPGLSARTHAHCRFPASHPGPSRPGRRRGRRERGRSSRIRAWAEPRGGRRVVRSVSAPSRMGPGRARPEAEAWKCWVVDDSEGARGGARAADRLSPKLPSRRHAIK